MEEADFLRKEHKDIEKALEEIKVEWRQFKNRALMVLIASLVPFAGYGIWIGTIQADIAHNMAMIEDNSTRLDWCSATQNDIRVQLARIEAILVEVQRHINNEHNEN